ncbi:MAG: YfhO family protein [Thermomicrobiales bacterium]
MVAVLVLVAVSLVRLTTGGTRIGLDAAVQIYPSYIFLGDQLRAGEIPFWNPHVFSGTPFVADFQSGWGYIPAMALFTLFPVWLAVPLWLAFHQAIAAFGTYVLARILGIGPGGAVVASISLVLSGWFWSRAGCCPIEVGVAAWMPLALIGVELSFRTRDWQSCVLWWIFAGASISQILTISFGPAGYYVLLAIVAFVAYRTVIAPATAGAVWRTRLLVGALNGGAIFLIAFGLSAVAALPRLEYLNDSNLAEGYETWQGVKGGWSAGTAADRILGRTSYYGGGSTVVFALAGIVLARRRPSVVFLGVLATAALLFSLRDATPIHWVPYRLLPKFEDLQSNLPERIMVVFYPVSALLAGFAVDALVQGKVTRQARVAALCAGLIATTIGVWSAVQSEVVPAATVLVMVLATGVIGLAVRISSRGRAAFLLPVVLAILLADLVLAGSDIVESGRRGLLQPHADLHAYYEPTPAARFLQELDGQSTGPFRFLSYAPGIIRGEPEGNVLYRYSFHRRTAAWFVLNNRATAHGLDDVQGQSNPMQIQRFAEYLTALNGRTQDYHDANIYAAGLESPLLDLLNARYIILPADFPPDRTDLERLAREYQTVYEDEHVRIVENQEALPRAWIVHDARTIQRGEALPLLAEGRIDPRQSALVEDELPALGEPPPGAPESATIITSHASLMAIATETAAPGLLVLSEISYPSWHAYVDGERVDVLVANHALRAVPIPAGRHQVELRYESTMFTVGLGLTVATLTACTAASSIVGFLWLRRRRSTH